MFASKPRKVSFTLFCYFALVLAIASVAQADSPSNHIQLGRDHAHLNRMIKKRADSLLNDLPNLGTNGAAGDPPKFDDSPSPGGQPTPTASAPGASATGNQAQSASSAGGASSASDSGASSASSVSKSWTRFAPCLFSFQGSHIATGWFSLSVVRFDFGEHLWEHFCIFVCVLIGLCYPVTKSTCKRSVQRRR